MWRKKYVYDAQENWAAVAQNVEENPGLSILRPPLELGIGS